MAHKRFHIVTIAREIRKVGIVDWLWFVVWLRRDEFSHRLGLNINAVDIDEHLQWLNAQRRRAHRIDMELSE